ncbi:MAG: IS5/IS1182 family transposase, partial [Actinomycetia bacterium]|nr:IS5/IS1182 family transposase [Actinomycetes bacterium]
RPMIEPTIAWLCRKHRRLRYRGIEPNQLGWLHCCAAINLQRLLTLGLTHNNEWAITKPA